MRDSPKSGTSSNLPGIHSALQPAYSSHGTETVMPALGRYREHPVALSDALSATGAATLATDGSATLPTFTRTSACPCLVTVPRVTSVLGANPKIVRTKAPGLAMGRSFNVAIASPEANAEEAVGPPSTTFTMISPVPALKPKELASCSVGLRMRSPRKPRVTMPMPLKFFSDILHGIRRHSEADLRGSSPGGVDIGGHTHDFALQIEQWSTGNYQDRW